MRGGPGHGGGEQPVLSQELQRRGQPCAWQKETVNPYTRVIGEEGLPHAKRSGAINPHTRVTSGGGRPTYSGGK